MLFFHEKVPFFCDWWFLCDFWWFLMAFLVIFWLGLGNPHHIATKSQQIKFWSILKKSWDWVRPPPPSLGQIPNFYRKFVLKASLILTQYQINHLVTTKCKPLLQLHILAVAWWIYRRTTASLPTGDAPCRQKGGHCCWTRAVWWTWPQGWT